MADYNINAVTRRKVFSGSAGTGPYAFTFEILNSGDLAVYFNATKLTLTTDFTVAINANGTGAVTIVVNGGGNVPQTPVSADQIVVVGARAIERVTDFVTAGDLLASSLNEQLDALTIFDQQVAEEAKRTMRAPVFDPALAEDGGVIDMTLPAKASRAGKTLAFDTNGNPTVGEDIGNWRGNWASGVAFTVRDLVKDASNSNVYRVNTAHTSSGSVPISTNTDAAKFDLVVDAAAAATSATAAASSATAAASSATASASSASAASGHKDSANTAKTAAESARDAAIVAKNAAETAADNFDDTYLGAKSSDPTADNDGASLTAGDLYFNTSSNVLKVYNGSAWQVAAVSASGLLAAANNLSELASAGTARANLGLVIGTNVQAFDANTKKAGKETIWIPAVSMYPNTTNGCAAIAQTELSNGPEIKTLDFDKDSDEFAQFSIAFPKSWNEGTVTFQAFFTANSTNTGTTVFVLNAVALADNGDLNTAFGTAVGPTAKAMSGTANDLAVTAESGAVTIAGSPSTDEYVFFQLMRDVSEDSLAADAKLLGIKLFFTTDAANDA